MTDTAPIHLFVPTFEVEACLRGVRECLERGWTGLGGKTLEFERAWSEYTGCSHAHFVNSATSGLELAVTLLGRHHRWEPGDEVITTPITFVSTNHAIVRGGYTPVFADVDDELCLDVASVESRIGPRTRAVMFVGLGGNVGQLQALGRLCADRHLVLILDAAHMAGTRWRETGEHVGFGADATVFSFQAVKNLPTGDAGMICFMNHELDLEARKWSWLGISKDTYQRTLAPGTYKWDYDVEHVGGKYHGNAIMAAIGLAQLAVLDRDNAYRRALVERYVAGLHRASHAALQRVVPILHRPTCESSRHLFQVRIGDGIDRDAVMMGMNALNVFPGVHYKSNTRYAVYANARGANELPVATRLSEQVVSLPLHLRMTMRDVDRVVEALGRAIEREHRRLGVPEPAEEAKRHEA
jgi:dTDP-4-amino-4,6-dideoxygalactose transaminase